MARQQSDVFWVDDYSVPLTYSVKRITCSVLAPVVAINGDKRQLSEDVHLA